MNEDIQNILGLYDVYDEDRTVDFIEKNPVVIQPLIDIFGNIGNYVRITGKLEIDAVEDKIVIWIPFMVAEDYNKFNIYDDLCWFDCKYFYYLPLSAQKLISVNWRSYGR